MNRRRLLMLQQEQEGLPSGYTQLNYLKSTGTQYINTGYIYGSNSDFSTEMYFFNAKGQLCGAVNDNARIALAIAQGALYFALYNGNLGAPSISYANYCYKLSTNGAILTATYTKDGSEHTRIIDNSAHDFDGTTIPFYLFGRNENGSANLLSGSMNIRFFSFFENGSTVMNLVPCLDSNGTPCMFDTVKRKTFYNAGTGDFLWG